jgi:crotonobetainyl-CoA:carnitine CoA-transferase CaiB-like acyl-CoA transferase
MLQAAASRLITTLPLLDYGCEPYEVTRSGNEHRKFIPTNVYRTADGYIYVAIGSDGQWRKLTTLPGFEGCANEVRLTNEGRHRERATIQADVAAAIARWNTHELAAALRAAGLPHAPINTVADVRAIPVLAARLTGTTRPCGTTVRLPPMAVDVGGARTSLHFPPRYGEHTRPILQEAGLSASDIDALYEAGLATGG